MHGAHFDPGGSAGKGLCSSGKTLLAAAPSASGWGTVAIDLGCQCLKTPIPRAVMGFRVSHVLSPLPLPVRVCFLFLSWCFPCKNYLSDPPASWPGLFYPVEQDLCCQWPVGGHICNPFPCCIPRSGVLLALSPADVLETGGFPAAPAMVLPQGEQRGVIWGR